MYQADNDGNLPTTFPGDITPYLQGAVMPTTPTGATYTVTYAAGPPKTVTIAATSPGGGTIANIVLN